MFSRAVYFWYLLFLFLPDMVRVISWGFPPAVPEPAAEAWTWARACVRLELLMVRVISWPLLPPATSPELPMTLLRSWEPAQPTATQHRWWPPSTMWPLCMFFSLIAVIHTGSILLRQSSHCDLRRCDSGGLQGQAGQWVDDNVGRHWGVSRRHELAPWVGDQTCVDTQGLREEAALL